MDKSYFMEKNEGLTLIETFLDDHVVVSGHMFGMPLSESTQQGLCGCF